jgi:2-polyprenyl-3-methyl-5-hydroxy-6-metoxy-1,4-benzoquinol methylase
MTVNDEAMTSILWRRLRYMLTPQFDLYKNIAPHMQGKQVLEVGFGTGFGTLLLAEYATVIYAIEPDADAVNFAKQVLPIRNISWLQRDITAMRVSLKYDAVVMVETLEHIADWRKALDSIHKRLRVGGCLYMTARNANADLRRNDLHERELSASELRANLGEFFLDVTLWDYTLANEQSDDTHITPLIAIARKAGGHEDSRIDTSKRWEQGRGGETHASNVRQAVARVDGGSGVTEQALNVLRG